MSIISYVAKQGTRRNVPIPKEFYEELPLGTEVEIVKIRTVVERIGEDD